MAHIIDRVKFDTLAILDCEPLLALEFLAHDQAEAASKIAAALKGNIRLIIALWKTHPCRVNQMERARC